MSADVQPRTLPYEFLLPPKVWQNETLVITAAALTLFWGGTVAGQFYWHLPGWMSFCCSVIAIHLSGTIIHEACHRAAHPNKIVNAALGHVSALMLGFAFPVFTRVHLNHHAKVNHPQNDADHFVSTGGPLWLIAPRFFYHEIFFFSRRLYRKFELLEWFLSRLYLVVMIGLALQFGYIHFVLNFWFVPALIVGITYGLFFDYFPHRPFHDQGRWHNARVYAGKLMNVLILSQNYHLIHHLWPSVPWYRIQTAHGAVKHLLDEKGSPQTFGVFDDRKNFVDFLYDVLIGVRIERQQPAKAVKLQADPHQPESKPALVA